MGKQVPMTQTIKASDARQQWSVLISEVFRKEKRVIVEEDGRPVAAVISTDDLARLDSYDRQRAERFKILDEVGTAFRDVPPEEIEREVGQALDQVRADAHQETSPTPARP